MATSHASAKPSIPPSSHQVLFPSTEQGGRLPAFSPIQLQCTVAIASAILAKDPQVGGSTERHVPVPFRLVAMNCPAYNLAGPFDINALYSIGDPKLLSKQYRFFMDAVTKSAHGCTCRAYVHLLTKSMHEETGINHADQPNEPIFESLWLREQYWEASTAWVS
jgi:hypothetical protein